MKCDIKEKKKEIRLDGWGPKGWEGGRGTYRNDCTTIWICIPCLFVNLQRPFWSYEPYKLGHLAVGKKHAKISFSYRKHA